MKASFIAFLTFLTVAAFSQGVFQGSVADANNEPLIGANVLLRENGKGTVATLEQH